MTTSGAPWPKSHQDNLEYRAKVQALALSDPQFAAACWTRSTEGFEGLLFWLNTFVSTYEPRAAQQTALGFKSATIPFVTWPYQDTYLESLFTAIMTGQDMLTEKARDMGVSWMVLAVMLWYWQFGKEGSDFLIGSRKEEYVDVRGNMSSLFPKLRFMLKSQPAWMLPGVKSKGGPRHLDLREEGHVKKYSPHLTLLNPETGSVIRGEANNLNFGSGGRVKGALLDEFAKWTTTDEAAWRSLGDTTPCRLPVSSANGTQNHFYRLRNGDEGEIKVERLVWRLHPLKDEVWYAGEKKRRSKSELAGEVDIDYAASVSNRAYEDFDFAIHVGECLERGELPLVLMCDFNIDPMCWSIWQEYGPRAECVGEMAMRHTSTSNAAEEFCKRYAGRRLKVVHIYGDYTGSYRQRAGKGLASDFDVLQRILKREGWNVGLHIQSPPRVPDRVKALNKRLKDYEHKDQSWILIDPSCRVMIESFTQTRAVEGGLDKKNNIEHMTDGPGYWADYRYSVRAKARSYAA